MRKPKNINLPFVETLKRSFMYTLCSWDLFLKVAAAGLVVVVWEVFSGFPVLCSLNSANCTQNFSRGFSSLLLALVSIGIIVNYCRAVILKSEVDYFSWAFYRRVLWYGMASIGLSALIFIPFFVVVLTLGQLATLMGAAAESELLSVAALAALVAWAIYLSPLFLMFPAITVDDKSFSAKELFELTKGNYNKIFWGQLLMMLPCSVAVYMLAFFYQSLGEVNFAAKIVFMVILLMLSFLDTCFKASFYAHIYQYFTYYKNKKSSQNKTVD